jgi:hypothetical protein
MSDSEQSDRMPKNGGWTPHLGSLFGGIAVGVVMVGAVWLLVAALMEGNDKGASPDSAEQGAALDRSPGTSSQPVTSSRLQRCIVAADDVERPLRLARPALDQWEVHVGAMNKLVVGEITLQQATAFWNQTRVGAYHRIGRFEDAEADLKRRGVDCPAPGMFGPGSSPVLLACEQHVAAELRALDRARTAIMTWDHHMHAMEQLRTGKLSPAAATQMWLTMWQRGVHELEEFRVAARAERHVGACNGPGDTPAPAPQRSGPRPNPASPTSPESSSEPPTESPMSGMDMH